MRILFSLLFIVFLACTAGAQSLPAQWRFSADNKYIIAGDQLSDGLYDESSIEEIRLYFSQSNYWTQLTQNYSTKKDIVATLKYKGATYDSVGVRFKGQTSYFMNSSQKKSFSISMDFVRDGQDLSGYKNLNLNNSWTDASFMREVLYYRLIRKHTPSAKAGFVRLYINDQDWGVYQNVQQLNKDFLEEWYENDNGVNMRADVPDGTSTGPGPGGGGGMWGDGTAGMNYLGPDTTLYKKYYTLKSSGRTDPWQQLIQACKILNTSGSSLETEAPKYFDIDKILWHLACEIAFGDDDSYVYKGKMDYYLYQDAETNRWATYDYDANSTLLSQHTTWSPFYNETKVNYPLLNKLLAIPAFRQRYIAHMKTIINDLLDETRVNTLIDGYDNIIRSTVFADPKKTTSNTAYTAELNVLKNFVKNRKASLLANTEIKAAAPVIMRADFFGQGANPSEITEGDQVLVTAKVDFTPGIYQVNIFYATGLSDPFTVLPMNDSGIYGDATAGDGTWSFLMPSKSAGTFARFYIEAVGNNTTKSRTYYPAGAEHELFYYSVKPKTSTAKTVVINEFMASNTGIIKDEFDETEDWIELHNLTNQDISLEGYNLTDSETNLSKFTFGPGVVIKANGYLIVWADEDSGTQGPLHANFRLSAAGEQIILLDPGLVVLDQVVYGQQTTNKSSARHPNGTGDFAIGDHTFNANNDGTTATGEQGEVSLSIYPNPTDGNVFIDNRSGADTELVIYDLSGRPLTRHTVVTGQSRLQLDNLPSGLYLARYGLSTVKLAIVRP